MRAAGNIRLASVAVAAAAAAAVASAQPARPSPAPVAVALTAADGVRIDGLFYRSAAPKATILLFH